MNHSVIQLLIRWAVLALGVTLATKVVDGIRCEDGNTLIIVVVLLSFFNAVLRPLLVLFTLPFILVTMGLGIVLINAFLFMLVGHLVDGFTVATFGAAFFGALIVGLTNIVLSSILGTKKSGAKPGPKRQDKSDDVIDI
jgi:putative membrane protein